MNELEQYFENLRKVQNNPYGEITLNLSQQKRILELLDIILKEKDDVDWVRNKLSHDEAVI